jgi:hypothetical protein
MKTTFLVLCFLLFFKISNCQNVVNFKISKPYCILNFIETATNKNGTSSTLKQYIVDNTKNDEIFASLCSDFKLLKLDYNFRREEFPIKRRQSWSTYDLLIINAVKSNDLVEFKLNTIGILPNNEHQKLFNLLSKIEIYYDKLIWINNLEKLKSQVIALEKYNKNTFDLFNAFKKFYNSSWSNDIPFVVSLYPIPGAKGNTTATPHANSLCVGVLADETRHEVRIGVVLHEMCHVLYDEQSKEFQHETEKYFNQNPSIFSKFAHNFIDEGLATALGNGFAYKSITGKIDTTQWYDNHYIDGFGKVLYPLVNEYLLEKKQIDKQFIDKSISLFEAQFPNSIADYSILLNRVSIYNDAETDQERNDLMNNIGQYFRIYSSNMSTPILDNYSLESIKNNTDTQLIVINNNHKKNLDQITKMFPELSKIKKNIYGRSFLAAFYDVKKRPVFVLSVKNNQELIENLKQMKAKKHFDLKTVLQNQ